MGDWLQVAWSLVYNTRYALLDAFKGHIRPSERQDSSVSTTTSYGLDGWGSILGRSKRFFSIPQHPLLVLGLT
jgi:hypothetical protein